MRTFSMVLDSRLRRLGRLGRRSGVLLAVSFCAVLVLAGCTESLPVHQDLSEDAFTMVTQDSSTVTFPNDYAGDILVIGAIYTQCPDVCPIVTGNMQSVRQRLGDTTGVRFVTVTFDPRRDTPSRMAAYRSAFGIDSNTWSFLTGSPSTVDTLMKRLEIKTSISSGDTLSTDESTGTYFIDHTDQITLVDERGRVRYRYHGSGTPPEIIIEDIERLRG